jgi:molecular chaperone GrpE (heat shock protein)
MTTRTLEAFGAIGLTEIQAGGKAFSEEEHEALETVEREPGQEPFQVVEVVRRGFRFDGSVLRRAQVLTSR